MQTVQLTSQLVMVQSLQPKGREFESTCVLVVFLLFLPLFDSLSSLIIDVSRHLSNVLWISIILS